MITREADYGIRVILALSKAWERKGACLSVGDIAREMDIPYRFLRKIAGRMATRGLIVSRKGKGGGLRLIKPPSTVSILDVLEVMAPESAVLSACVSKPDRCKRASGCAISKALRDIQCEMANKLRLVTFDDLMSADQRGV